MIQRTDAYTILRRFWLPSLLAQSLSWIGVSLLSSNLVLAQTQISDAVVVPTKTESKPPAAAPVVSAPVPQIAPAPAKGTIRQKLAPTLVPVRRERPAPRLSVPTRAVAQPRRNSPSTVQAKPTRKSEKAATNSTANYNGAYIDPTEYRIGATRGYEAPSSVVLSERSTGCRAVLRQGQGPSGICGTAQQRRTRVAVRGTQPTNSVRSRSQAPSSWVRGVARSGISAVRVAPIRTSTNGFRANKKTSSQGQIALGSAVSARSMFYYKRTPSPAVGSANSLMFPLTVPAPITSLFGWRIHPITGNRRFHSGTDFGASLGTPVLAANAGKVAIADFLGGYGLTVVLEHKKFTQQTLYGHLSEIFVQSGEWVEQGAVIGRVGSTGNSTGPHLHFETRQLTPEGWVATDPSVQLEDALAQLAEFLRADQSSQRPGT